MLEAKYRRSGEEPAQLRLERSLDEFDLIRVFGQDTNVNAVVALHEGVVNAYRKHAYTDYHTVTFHIAGRELTQSGAVRGAIQQSVPLAPRQEENVAGKIHAAARTDRGAARRAAADRGSGARGGDEQCALLAGVPAPHRRVDTTCKPLVEIAHDLEFASQSHMTTLFSQLFGVAPGVYRERIAEPFRAGQ